MGTFYRFIVGLFLLASQAWAIANGPITESAWLEDPTGQWTLKDVQSRDFTPFTGLLNKGYSEKALWIRLYDPSTSSVQIAGDLHSKSTPASLSSNGLGYNASAGLNDKVSDKISVHVNASVLKQESSSEAVTFVSTGLHFGF